MNGFDVKLHSRSKKGKIWLKTDGKCYYCGKQLHYKKTFTKDHLVPKVIGGPSNISNLVPCCQECNQLKGDSSLEDFQKSKKTIELSNGALTIFPQIKSVRIVKSRGKSVVDLSFDEVDCLNNVMSLFSEGLV